MAPKSASSAHIKGGTAALARSAIKYWRVLGKSVKGGDPTVCEHGILNSPHHKDEGKRRNRENFPGRFETRKSWVDNTTEREFFVMNISGKATRNQAYPLNWKHPQECKMQYYVHLATCEDCCCKKGYIQSEANAANLSPEGHNCERAPLPFVMIADAHDPGVPCHDFILTLSLTQPHLRMVR